MAFVNDNMLKLPGSYLFAEISKRVAAYKAQHPQVDIISLGIGDVTQPLCPAVVQAIHKAADEMAQPSTFRGYGPEQGYMFLREAIIENDFMPRGIRLDADEVFISDGAKSDTGNMQELLSSQCVIGVTDPIYPVYVDSNAMSGRAGSLNADGHWSRLVYMPCMAENNFVPQLPEPGSVDAVYLCYPNNPTGTVINRDELRKWVDYALQNHVLIFYDAAYEAYITDPAIPHSIYEISGAKKCAIEFHSFSKTAGFTGIRCGYTVVPKELTVRDNSGGCIPLNQLWARRQSTKFNGASYISQRAAEAVFTASGKEQISQTINYYMRNAKEMLAALRNLGYQVFGGENAPYLWVKTPEGSSSWQFFDRLLNTANVVCTPGVGFGPAGEGYVRLTAFGTHKNTREALQRIAARGKSGFF